jgi:DNA topoisomerase-1
MTKLERLQKTGIQRLGSPKTGFRYRHADGTSINKGELARINALRIPPAWTEVAINAATNGRVQAVGKDAAGRWQYLYHANHTKTQEERKFQRLAKFAQALPKLRATVRRDLRRNDLSRERVLAGILRILSTCFMRPGSQVYASEHGSYGIATLRRKHVTVKGDVVEFDFPGKSGVRQQQQLQDRQVARVIRSTMKLPGFNVFKYVNGDDRPTVVTRQHINDYIKEVMGEGFTAKDFRTWAGTLYCACALASTGSEESESATARKKKIVTAIKATAAILGNTPAVCRSSYICPAIISEFERGNVIDNSVCTPPSLMSFKGHGLQKPERALLRFLRKTSK